MVNNQDEKIKHEKRVNMNINRHPNLFIKNPKIYGLNCTEHFDGVINQQSWYQIVLGVSDVSTSFYHVKDIRDFSVKLNNEFLCN